ncbi:hypothetical protein [Arthrobacter sp. ZGTC412]|uniref:hypothetical protein n=1 Tax=Arthrobacter sp. ZGTC412 TaxID=2058900 RepID=UPI0011B03B68|nr:hypothetical protein [Arthrobacter sp. ZGTC412]
MYPQGLPSSARLSSSAILHADFSSPTRRCCLPGEGRAADDFLGLGAGGVRRGHSDASAQLASQPSLVSPQGAEIVVDAMASSYVNANGSHIGIPVAVYAVGNATPVAPVLIVQLLALSPLFLLLLNLSAGESTLLGQKT